MVGASMCICLQQIDLHKAVFLYTCNSLSKFSQLPFYASRKAVCKTLTVDKVICFYALTAFVSFY